MLFSLIKEKKNMSFPLSLSIMKLPLKHIVILVICSLTGIFVYQAYWLTGLYRTMKQEMENNIRDAMRTSDFNEIVLLSLIHI